MRLPGNGGAVSISSAGASFENCTFTTNQAMYGGALELDSAATLNAGAPNSTVTGPAAAAAADGDDEGRVRPQLRLAAPQGSLCRSAVSPAWPPPPCAYSTSPCLPPRPVQLTAPLPTTTPLCLATTSTWTTQVGAGQLLLAAVWGWKAVHELRAEPRAEMHCSLCVCTFLCLLQLHPRSTLSPTPPQPPSTRLGQRSCEWSRSAAAM